MFTMLASVSLEATMTLCSLCIVIGDLEPSDQYFANLEQAKPSLCAKASHNNLHFSYSRSAT